MSDSSGPHRLQGRFVAHQTADDHLGLSQQGLQVMVFEDAHWIKGLAAPETGQAYARAELWEQLGSPCGERLPASSPTSASGS